MGNKFSCCKHSTPQVQRKSTVLFNEVLPDTDASLNNIQHISEREGADCDDVNDPSQHPKVKTIFMERCKENGINHRKSQYQLAQTRSLKKSSSCSTIYLDDSTVSQPNLKNTVKCVSLAIYYHIKNRMWEREIAIFDERLHPLTRDNRLNGLNEDHFRRNPDHKQIYKFIRVLFNSAQLTAECAIITLIYLERLLTYAELDIAPSNWKRIVLGAILLASKVWDDQAVWNVDYCQILKDVNVDDMNCLEKEFLELLQFNINVPSSIYAKYYFDLRTLAEQNNLSFPSEPLSRSRAQKLEAMSRVVEDRITTEIGCVRVGNLKKWSSLDNVSNGGGGGGVRRSVAILS